LFIYLLILFLQKVMDNQDASGRVYISHERDFQSPGDFQEAIH